MRGKLEVALKWVSTIAAVASALAKAIDEISEATSSSDKDDED